VTAIDLKFAATHFKAYGPKLTAAAHRGLLAAAQRGVQVIQSEIIPSRNPQPVDRGVYRAGWRAGPIPEGAEIFNVEPTAVLIEEGVRGQNVKIGRLMLAALSEWAKRKGLGRYRATSTVLGKRKDGSFFAKAQKVKFVAGDTSIAWAIAKAMQKRGIFNKRGPGLGILRELVAKRLNVIVDEEIIREIERELAK